jgi:hypothetical protein
MGGILQFEKLGRIPRDLASLQFYVWVPRAAKVNIVAVLHLSGVELMNRVLLVQSHCFISLLESGFSRTGIERVRAQASVRSSPAPDTNNL